MDLSNFGIKNNKNIPKEITTKNLNINLEIIQNELKNEKIEKFLPWFLKFKVEKFEDLIITKEIKKIINYIENFEKSKKKGLLLVGSAGSGKTTTLTLIGEKYNFEIFEINASDARNKKSINETLGDVINQKSLFQKNKLILIDEVDGVSGTNDRGGITEIIKLMKKSKFPIVFTANEKESNKIKALKKNTIVIDFENHSKELLEKIATNIFNSEKINYNKNELLEFIEKRNTSDIRGFINDLQTSVIENNFEINENLDIRNYKKKIDLLLEKIYYSYPENALKESYNSDIKIDDLFLFLEENTPDIYLKNSIISAFNQLSKADVFRGRIMKYQYWRYLVYINFYLTFGISAEKSNQIKHNSTFKKNERILKKWIYGNKYNSLRPRTKIEKKNDKIPLKFIEKLAKYYGTSVKNTRKNELFYFTFIYKKNKIFAEEMNKLLEIDQITKETLLKLD